MGGDLEGTYHLVETQAPEGYFLSTDPAIITVSEDDVSYDEGTG